MSSENVQTKQPLSGGEQRLMFDSTEAAAHHQQADIHATAQLSKSKSQPGYAGRASCFPAPAADLFPFYTILLVVTALPKYNNNMGTNPRVSALI